MVLHAGDHCSPFSLAPLLAADLPFAGVFGRIAQQYFQKYGDQSDALAMIAAKNHKNGVANPYAQMRKDFGYEFCRAESEKNPRVAGPLKRTDCSLVSDGAAALVLMTADEAKKRGLKPLARIASGGELDVGVGAKRHERDDERSRDGAIGGDLTTLVFSGDVSAMGAHAGGTARISPFDERWLRAFAVSATDVPTARGRGLHAGRRVRWLLGLESRAGPAHADRRARGQAAGRRRASGPGPRRHPGVDPRGRRPR